jgi:hypothetical protein
MPQQATNKLILLAIVFLGLALGYMYTIYFVEPMVLPQPQSSSKVNAARLSESINKIKWDVTESLEFKSLEIFGESPVVPGLTGKRDIFAPI